MTSNVSERTDVITSIILVWMTVALHDLCNATNLYYQTNDTVSINNYILAIKPRSKKMVFQEYEWHEFRSTPFIVQNIGRDEVIVSTVELSVRKLLTTNKIALLPSRRATFELQGMYTHIMILNNRSSRAIVYASAKNEKWYIPTQENSYDIVLKKAFTLGVKDIPNIDDGLQALLAAFWPQFNGNVWEQVHRVLKTTLGNDTAEQISVIIDQKIALVKKHIVALNEDMKNYKKSNNANQYMQIAHLLIDLDKEFVFSDRPWTNFYILPYYSAAITLKMNFYTIGIAKPYWFDLTEDQLTSVKRYAKETLYMSNGAIKYVKNMFNVAITELYNIVRPERLYNVMMIARSHIALHGLEMIPKWEMAYNNPQSKQSAYVDVISYSSFYGSATPTLFQQATPFEVPAPLTPPLINGQRAKLLTIECYTDSTRLVGLNLTFEDSSNYILGVVSNYTNIIDLNNRTITKLGVFGDDRTIRSLLFYTFDEVHYCSKENGGTFHHFSLKGHHISSLYLGNGNDPLFPGTQDVVNVAVSFLQNPLGK